jgi:hypothetical protein
MYRVGWLTSIDYDENTGSVELDDSVSSAHPVTPTGHPTHGGAEIVLSVNQDWPLDQIPFYYMDCDAEAFLVGDRVVVRFADYDWHDATIIGFESNPRECPWSSKVGLLFVRTYGTPANGLSCGEFIGLGPPSVQAYNLEYALTPPAGGRQVLYTPSSFVCCLPADVGDLIADGTAWKYAAYTWSKSVAAGITKINLTEPPIFSAGTDNTEVPVGPGDEWLTWPLSTLPPGFSQPQGFDYNGWAYVPKRLRYVQDTTFYVIFQRDHKL